MNDFLSLPQSKRLEIYNLLSQIIHDYDYNYNYSEISAIHVGNKYTFTYWSDTRKWKVCDLETNEIYQIDENFPGGSEQCCQIL